MGFFDAFTGGSQKKAIRQASAKANAELDAGFEGANQRYDEAFDLFTPYAQQGAEGATAYRNALLGSPEERAGVFNAYSQDPAMAGILGQQTNQLLRKYNASGSGTGGGRLALAGARVGLENYNSYLDRLGGLGGQGLQVAGAQSGIRSGQGDLRWNLAGTKAGNSIQTGSALANASTGSMNNLLKLGGLAIKGASLF